MAHPPQTLATLSGATRLPLIAVLALRFAAVVTYWDHLYRSRTTLKDLDPHLLRDIGLTPEQAAQEWQKPFWRS